MQMRKCGAKSGTPDHGIYRSLGTIFPDNTGRRELFERPHGMQHATFARLFNGWHHDHIAQTTHGLIDLSPFKMRFPAIRSALE